MAGSNIGLFREDIRNEKIHSVNTGHDVFSGSRLRFCRGRSKPGDNRIGFHKYRLHIPGCRDTDQNGKIAVKYPKAPTRAPCLPLLMRVCFLPKKGLPEAALFSAHKRITQIHQEQEGPFSAIVVVRFRPSDIHPPPGRIGVPRGWPTPPAIGHGACHRRRTPPLRRSCRHPSPR